VPFRQLDFNEQERVLDALLELTAQQVRAGWEEWSGKRARHIQNIRAYILNDDMWGMRRIR